MERIHGGFLKCGAHNGKNGQYTQALKMKSFERKNKVL
jgi:hypothetical protein